MEDINKQGLREKYINIRKNIDNREIKCKIIFEKIIKSEVYIKANTVAIYKNTTFEVDTSELIKYSLNQGKTIALPVTKENDMEFYIYTLNEELKKGKFGIEEPFPNPKNILKKEVIDVAIVPGVCFDKSKNRLGYGKGYYDRYLKDSNIKTIGICFNEQIVDKLPVDKFDVKMDILISDKANF